MILACGHSRRRIGMVTRAIARYCSRFGWAPQYTPMFHSFQISNTFTRSRYLRAMKRT